MRQQKVQNQEREEATVTLMCLYFGLGTCSVTQSAQCTLTVIPLMLARIEGLATRQATIPVIYFDGNRW
jgi:hypothetical protein